MELAQWKRQLWHAICHFTEPHHWYFTCDMLHALFPMMFYWPFSNDTLLALFLWYYAGPFCYETIFALFLWNNTDHVPNEHFPMILYCFFPYVEYCLFLFFILAGSFIHHIHVHFFYYHTQFLGTYLPLFIWITI